MSKPTPKNINRPRTAVIPKTNSTAINAAKDANGSVTGSPLMIKLICPTPEWNKYMSMATRTPMNTILAIR